MPNRRQNPPMPKVIEILAFPDVQLLDVAGPLQVFASANEWAGRLHGTAPYVTQVVARSTPVITSAGLALVAEKLQAGTARRRDRAIDTLVVAGGRGVHAAAADPRLVDWVAGRSLRARRVASVCTGAFLLGAAGLLEGRRVVTHWAECDGLASRHPGAHVERDPIFIADRGGGRAVWSSAGVTAGIDLSLALVEEDLGQAVAIAVARDLVVFMKRPGGQSQFSDMLALQASGDAFGRLHGWIAGRLERDLSVPVLAAEAGMSERSFVRHYRASTGMTPARAVERMRIEAARQLLATTRLPAKRIARRCGFGSEETMRRSFVRQLAVTPQEYRDRFTAPA